jgi:hypothetical protein
MAPTNPVCRLNRPCEAAGGIYDYGLDEATWVEFSKRHASVVFPCFELQRRLREHVLGKVSHSLVMPCRIRIGRLNR